MCDSVIRSVTQFDNGMVKNQGRCNKAPRGPNEGGCYHAKETRQRRERKWPEAAPSKRADGTDKKNLAQEVAFVVLRSELTRPKLMACKLCLLDTRKIFEVTICRKLQQTG